MRQETEDQRQASCDVTPGLSRQVKGQQACSEPGLKKESSSNPSVMHMQADKDRKVEGSSSLKLCKLYS